MTTDETLISEVGVLPLHHHGHLVHIRGDIVAQWATYLPSMFQVVDLNPGQDKTPEWS